MSRIGNMPLSIPKEVTVTISEKSVTINGPKGNAHFTIPDGITVTKDQTGEVTIATDRVDKAGKSMHGYVRAQLQNDITGLTQGFVRTLEMVGVGYRAAVTGVNLVLNVGFSHAVTMVPPQGIAFKVEDNKIHVTGQDKQLVGQIAANIRAVKPPEPYKGKGIRFSGEYVRKKAGKAAKVAGGGAK